MNTSPDAIIEGRSWFKTAGIGCVVFLLAFVVVSIIITKWFSQGPEVVKTLPENIPESFVWYRPEAIDTIIAYPAESKRRGIRLIAAPIGAVLNMLGQDAVGMTTVIEKGFGGVQWDTVSVSWKNLETSRDDIELFYAGALKQVGVAESNIQLRRSNDTRIDEMVGSTATFAFRMILVDDPETPVIDALTVVIEYPSDEGNVVR